MGPVRAPSRSETACPNSADRHRRAIASEQAARVRMKPLRSVRRYPAGATPAPDGPLSGAFLDYWPDCNLRQDNGIFRASIVRLGPPILMPRAHIARGIAQFV